MINAADFVFARSLEQLSVSAGWRLKGEEDAADWLKAEAEAKLRVVKMYIDNRERESLTDEERAAMNGLYFAILSMAMVWSDHESFEEEWSLAESVEWSL